MTIQFGDETVTVESAFGPLTVIVSGEALHVLWGDGIGPQDGPGLVAANREIIDQVATMKFEADEGEDEFRVRITALDLEA